MTEDEKKRILSEIEKMLPAVFARKELGRLTGNLVAPGTVANAMSRGDGPEGVFRIGKNTGLQRSDFLKWLAKRIA